MLPRPSTPTQTPLADLAARVGAAQPSRDVPVSGVCLDSRRVRPGDLYAALPGANAHGAQFATGALARGAVAVLTDARGVGVLREAGVDLPVIEVADPRAAMGQVSAQVYGTDTAALPLIGITGTNGKTTTAYLIASALQALGRTPGLIGTVEIRIGTERVPSERTTPESSDLHGLLAVMRERGADSCVMEVSSHALVLHRVDGAVFDLALFTNLSQDHLDFHADMEDYFRAKASLFTPERARRGIVCVDDPWGARLAREAGVPVQTLRSADAATASEVPDPDWLLQPDAQDEMAFTLRGRGTTLRLASQLPGDFNQVNTALAALALLATGVPAAEVERAVAAPPHVPGRMERVTATEAELAAVPAAVRDRLPMVVVDYAHTPDAVAVALASLRRHCTGRLVVVVGAGGDRDRGKRPLMGRAAAEGADIVMVTNDNPRSEDPATIRAAVLEGARSAGTCAELYDVERRSLAVRRAVRAAYAAGSGSVVAVVGKGHETGQQIGGEVIPFDDREQCREALGELLQQVQQEKGDQ